jgi:Initiator Replication protein
MSKTKPSTLEVVADRRHELDTLIAPGELVNMRFQHGKTTLSLRGAKLLHCLIDGAGAEAGNQVLHSLPIHTLNTVFHLSLDEFLEVARELWQTSIQVDFVRSNGEKAVMAGPLLGHVARDYDNNGDLQYEISRVMRHVLRSSNHWAELSRKAVMAFQSRYSLRLYELISLRMRLDKVHSETFPIADFRSLFGVPQGKLKTWQNLKEKVIEPAIAEVSHLTGLTVSYEPVKRGRSVTAIKLIWREKDAKARAAAARELDTSSIGRQARRDGTAETIVDGQEAVTAEDFRKLAAQLGSYKKVGGERYGE